MKRISNNQMYFIFTATEKMNYVNSAVGIENLSKVLNRSKQSVVRSIKNLGKKEFILNDRDGNKYLIISEMELRG